MPEARINGTDIHYREAGEGFPVFLIHGFSGNLRNWALQIPVLTGHFRTVSIDQRGHGLSAKPTQPEDYTLEAMADDAYGLLEHLGIEECYLVGHSMGGMVAQQLTLSHRQRVRALVLVDTTADRPDPVRNADRARLVQIAQEQGLEAVFEEQLRMNPQAAQLRARPDLLENWRQQFLMTSPQAYLACARAMAYRRPLLEELGSVGAPTLIICGENDEPFLEPSRHIQQRIAASELAIIAGAGHTPQIEKPAQFNEALLGFLLRVHEGVAAGG